MSKLLMTGKFWAQFRLLLTERRFLIQRCICRFHYECLSHDAQAHLGRRDAWLLSEEVPHSRTDYGLWPPLLTLFEINLSMDTLLRNYVPSRVCYFPLHTISIISRTTGPLFTKKTPSYGYRDPHYKSKTV